MKVKFLGLFLAKFIILILFFSLLLIIYPDKNNLYILAEKLNFFLNFHQKIDILFKYIDQIWPLFPSKLRVLWWQPKIIALELAIYISLGLTCLLQVLFFYKKFSTKYKLFIYSGFFAALIFIVIPVRSLVISRFDTWIRESKFDLNGFWLPETVWMAADPEVSHPYISYRYTWNQNKKTQAAKVQVSCLGHYRLSVNGKRIYHGPEFAVEPNIYVDSIDINEYIKLGQNQLEIVCIYVDGITHEYPHYDQAAVLVGGYIKDGWWQHTLSDYRLWEYAELKTVTVKERLFNAGWVEDYDLTILPEYKPVTNLPNLSYQIATRPLPLLQYKSVAPEKISNQALVYDLSKFTPGYLSITAIQDEACELDIVYGVELDEAGFPKLYMGQADKVKLTTKETIWEQLSRRSGRYIGLKGNCNSKSLDLDFTQVYRNFNQPTPPANLNKEDQAIFELARRSLEINVQDQFEDSVVRERAMYLGDALAVSQCLPATSENDQLIRQAILQFAQSQHDDGSFPSMAPSGKAQFIPEYSLQWPTWLYFYFEKTKDTDFIIEMWPHVETAINWAEDNTSAEGFFYNKTKNEKWWNFIDWSPVAKTHPYITAQQLWYLESLEAAAKLAQATGHDAKNYQQKADALRAGLQEKAIDDHGLFVDSFSTSGEKAAANLVTNALAGKLHMFTSQEESKAALEQFKKLGLYTYSPYSQTWVIEWAITAGEESLALEILRGYWGSMLSSGATSIYERHHPTEQVRDRYDSYSHAWGCGPVWLYQQLSK